MARDPGFMFVPWEMTRSLNTLGELLLALSPPQANESFDLFSEAANVANATLAVAPSFNEVRKQLAIALEGVARASLARGGDHANAARSLLDQSANTWRDVASRSVGDVRDADRVIRVEQLLTALSPHAPSP